MRIIPTLAMLLAAGVASAQTKDQLAELGLAGVGATPCREVIAHFGQSEQSRKISELVYLSWAQGFISGINQQFRIDNIPMKNLFEWSPDAQIAHLMAFCDKHQSDLFVYAVHDLFDALPDVTKRK